MIGRSSRRAPRREGQPTFTKGAGVSGHCKSKRDESAITLKKRWHRAETNCADRRERAIHTLKTRRRVSRIGWQRPLSDIQILVHCVRTIDVERGLVASR
jgi:hypothetical protein